MSDQFYELFYLTNNPDVARAVNQGYIGSGWTHYQAFGHDEDRSFEKPENFDPDFNEEYYLARNPDVAAYLKGQQTGFGSGWDHYQRVGQKEGRSYDKPEGYGDFNEEYYLANNPDVAKAVSQGLIGTGWAHYQAFGQEEGRSYDKPEGYDDFNEWYYLANNPDVAATLNSDNPKFGTGWHHYQKVGQDEDRSYEQPEEFQGVQFGGYMDENGSQFLTVTDEPQEVWSFDGGAVFGEVAVNQEGYTYSSSSTDDTVRKIDPEGNQVWSFEEHENRVTSLAVDQDGYAYSASERHDTVRKIDLEGNQVGSFEGHGSNVGDVAVDQDGYLYIGYYDNTLHKLSPEGNQIWSYDENLRRVTSVEVDKEGYVYSASNSYNHVHKTNPDGEQEWRFDEHERNILDVAVDEDGYVYTASYDNTVRKIDPEGDQVWSFEGHDDWVFGVAVDQEGNVYSASRDNTVRKIDSEGNEVWSFDGHSYSYWGVSDVDVDQDGNVYSAASDHTVRKIAQGAFQDQEIDQGATAHFSALIENEGTESATREVTLSFTDPEVEWSGNQSLELDAGDFEIVSFELDTGSLGLDAGEYQLKLNTGDETETVTLQIEGDSVDPEAVSVTSTAIDEGDYLYDSDLSGTFEDPDTGSRVYGDLEWDNKYQTVYETGDFGWIFTPDDQDSYNEIDGYVEVEVDPDPVDPEEAASVTASAIDEGDYLYQSDLSGTFEDPDTGSEVDGDLEWDNSSQTVDETGDFGWIFTPDDQDSYNEINGYVEVEVYPDRVDPEEAASVTASAIDEGDYLYESDLSGTFEDPDTGSEVDGDLEWDNSSQTVDETGDFEWIFTPDDQDSYNEIDGYVEVETVEGDAQISVDDIDMDPSSPEVDEEFTVDATVSENAGVETEELEVIMTIGDQTGSLVDVGIIDPGELNNENTTVTFDSFTDGSSISLDEPGDYTVDVEVQSENADPKYDNESKSFTVDSDTPPDTITVTEEELREAASEVGGGDESFTIERHDNEYTFWDSEYNIDTSQVTDMSNLFQDTDFDGDIGYWDVSNVEDMNNMFFQAYDFNNDGSASIDRWNVSNVTDMQGMFDSSDFRQDIGSWDVSSVKDMSWMFQDAEHFINGFSDSIGEWNVSNAHDMSGMFYGADMFNNDIGSWDVSSVKDMSWMFGFSGFNRNIGNWNVSSVENMKGMFCPSHFNQDISSWDVTNVKNMQYMFNNAEYFDQDISSWTVPLIDAKPDLFADGSPLEGKEHFHPQWGENPYLDNLKFSETTGSEDVKDHVYEADELGMTFSYEEKLPDEDNLDLEAFAIQVTDAAGNMQEIGIDSADVDGAELTLQFAAALSLEWDEDEYLMSSQDWELSAESLDDLQLAVDYEGGNISDQEDFHKEVELQGIADEFKELSETIA